MKHRKRTPEEEILFQQFSAKQLEMAKKVTIPQDFDLSKVHIIGGIDLATWEDSSGKEQVVGCLVLFRYPTLEVIDEVVIRDEHYIPYIPTCLGFREVPVMKKLTDNVSPEIKPDILLVDGNGLYHPRGMGSATHLGIEIDIPTVGVSKNIYKLEGLSIIPTDDPHVSKIVSNDKILGYTYAHKLGVRPVYISVGNNINLEASLGIVKNCCTKKSHQPLPTWVADMETHRWRNYYTKGYLGGNQFFRG